MTTAATEFKYDVAISFLNPDLAVAQELADLLRGRMSVFLFTERQVDIAGSDGVETLSRVFRKEARLVVVLFRNDWGATPWTRLEAEAIKSRGLEMGWDSLLLIPLEPNPKVPAWVPKSRVWLGYSTYGLQIALPVVERMLEELGGEAKTQSAADLLQRLAREARWEEERQRVRRSQQGVEESKRQVESLFAEIARDVASVDGADVAFKQVDPRSARLWSSKPRDEGTTVTLYWSLQWGNTLDQSGLRVKLYKGFAAAGNEYILADANPVELQRHVFDLDLIEPGRWVWRRRDTDKVYDTSGLAAVCVELLAVRVSGI